MYNYQQIFDRTTETIIDYAIVRLQDNAWIPNNPENTDWQDYQKWLEEGNTPLPPA
jgi:hypothetical protein